VTHNLSDGPYIGVSALRAGKRNHGRTDVVEFAVLVAPRLRRYPCEAFWAVCGRGKIEACLLAFFFVQCEIKFALMAS